MLPCIRSKHVCCTLSQVLLLSARNALLSRLVLRGQASQEVKARFVQLAFGRFANPKTIPQVRRARVPHPGVS